MVNSSTWFLILIKVLIFYSLVFFSSCSFKTISDGLDIPVQKVREECSDITREGKGSIQQILLFETVYSISTDTDADQV